MKQKDLFRMLLMAFIFVVGLSACNDHEDDILVGDWDPMEWKTEVKMDETHNISVPADGGTYQFTCTNYPGFWISVAKEEEQYVQPDDENRRHYAGKWSSAQVEGNVMTVVISPNETDSLRSVRVEPSAGDIFDSFTFNQANQ